VLCLLRGSRWILSDALPGSATTFTSAALGCGSVAVLYLLVFGRSRRWRDSPGQIVQPGVAGAMLIAGPLAGLWRPGLVSAAGLTMALALTPVVLVVVQAALQQRGEALAGRLWPGLAAVAGLLLLLAQPSLSNPGRDLLLVLAPVLSGWGAALFCSTPATAWRLPAALLGGCAVLSLGASVNYAMHVGSWPDMPGLAAGLDAAEALLSLLTLSRLSATRWSAQFAIVPLLVVLEGIVLMHSRVPQRMIVGLALLAAAGTALLVPPAEEVSIDLGASRVEPGGRD
jgi:drug/metabolite transporter (DMT)-like permease